MLTAQLLVAVLTCGCAYVDVFPFFLPPLKACDDASAGADGVAALSLPNYLGTYYKTVYASHPMGHRALAQLAASVRAHQGSYEVLLFGQSANMMSEDLSVPHCGNPAVQDVQTVPQAVVSPGGSSLPPWGGGAAGGSLTSLRTLSGTQLEIPPVEVMAGGPVGRKQRPHTALPGSMQQRNSSVLGAGAAGGSRRPASANVPVLRGNAHTSNRQQGAIEGKLSLLTLAPVQRQVGP